MILTDHALRVENLSYLMANLKELSGGHYNDK